MKNQIFFSQLLEINKNTFPIHITSILGGLRNYGNGFKEFCYRSHLLAWLFAYFLISFLIDQIRCYWHCQNNPYRTNQSC